MSLPPIALWIRGSHASAREDSIIWKVDTSRSVYPTAMMALGKKRGVRGRVVAVMILLV